MGASAAGAGRGVGSHELAGEPEDVVIEGGIGRREGVGHLEGFAGGEGRVFAEPLFDVGPLPLHEVLCQFAALDLR